MLLRFIMLLSLALSTVVSLVTGAFESYKWLWMLPVVAFWAFLAFMLCVYGYLQLLCRRVDLDQEQDGDDQHYRKFAELIVESVTHPLCAARTAAGVYRQARGSGYVHRGPYFT